MSGTKITGARLVMAAVAAADARHDGFAERSKVGDEVASRCSFIIGVLQADTKTIAVDRIATEIAALLKLRLDAYWRNAWVRYRCAEIEEALGLPHGAETQAAIDAKRANANRAWEDYCEQFKAPATEACA